VRRRSQWGTPQGPKQGDHAVPHADRMVGPISALERRFYATLDST
jgi:hypothetical protein